MKRTLNIMLTAVTLGLVAYLGGCGPENLNDADYVAQMNEAGLDQDAVSAKDDAAPMLAGKLPTRHIRMPSQVERQEDVVINTAEDRNYEQEIHHWLTIHRPQREVTNHTINNLLTKRNIYHTNVLHHPSKCTKVFQTNRVVETQEVVPTTEATTPVRIGCGGACYGPRFYRGYGFGGYRGYGYGWGYRGFGYRY